MTTPVVLRAVFEENTGGPASSRETRIEVFAAETWALQWQVVNDAGEPKDLASASAIWVLKRFVEGVAELLRKVPVIDPNQVEYTGRVALSVPASDTFTLASGRYYYELQITDAAGKTRKVAYGNVLLYPTAIRS